MRARADLTRCSLDLSYYAILSLIASRDGGGVPDPPTPDFRIFHDGLIAGTIEVADSAHELQSANASLEAARGTDAVNLVVGYAVVQFPAEWVQHFGVDLVTAFPPDLGARFRYHVRLRPQRSFASIVERMLASDPDFRVHLVGEMVRTVTTEGEYGAWVSIEGRREGAAAERHIGAVFMDEFSSALDCIAIIPKHFATVRRLSLDLLRSAAYHLVDRPRRFFYVPPVGWQGIPSGATANWYPLDFPNNLSNISIPPALKLVVPAEVAINAALADLGAGLTVESTVRDEFVAASGVRGTYLRLHGARAGRAGPIYREMMMFVVAGYSYCIRLESGMPSQLGDMRELLRGVAGSFKALPTHEESRVGRAFAVPSDAFDHWAS